MEQKSNIYVFTNKINGKKYVGQTINIEKRYKQHMKDSKHKDYLFYRAIRKYGENNFDFKIIEENIDLSIINNREKFWIKELNSKIPNGYNLTDGGEGTFGYHHTEEDKKKMSILKIGKPLSEEHKHKIRKANEGENNFMYGKHHLDETKQKISKSNTGKVRDEETKSRISSKLKGIPHTEEHNKNVSIGLKNRDEDEKRKSIEQSVKTKKENGMDFAKHFRNMDNKEKEKMYNKISDSNPRRKEVKGINLETKEEFVFGSIGKAGKWIHEVYGYSINAKNSIRRAIENNQNAYGYKWILI